MNAYIERIKFLIQYISVMLHYLYHYPKLRKLRNIQVMNSEETIKHLLKHNCSMSRFGDGEFEHAWQYLTGEHHINEQSFQRYDERLGKRLAELMNQNEYDNERHIVCLPYGFYHPKLSIQKNKKNQMWGAYYLYTHYKLLFSTVNPDRKYFNSLVTRFYVSHGNRNRAERHVTKMKGLWQDRDICFIEGEKSLLGVGNDLFFNAKSIKRILCPSVSAFDKYNEIMNEALKQPKDTLFILALGMTATVMAYDLSQAGYQALDLGHIDIEYEWMLMGAKKPVPIPHKYVNETADGKNPETLIDTEYENQIIARIL